MSLKQTGKGNKSSEPEDNTAYREATTETIPLFIYFNSSPTFKAMKTAGSAYPALQILHFSLCSVCGNKWTFSPFQLKFVGPLPWPSTTQRQKGERTLHHRFQQWVALTEQGTVWCANVAPEYTPQAALGSIPTILIQDSTGKQASLSISSCLHTSCHCTGYSPPANLLQLFPKAILTSVQSTADPQLPLLFK